jgi:rubrerythrin
VGGAEPPSFRPQAFDVRLPLPLHGKKFEIGLVAEKKAYDFYDAALPGIADPEVRTLFTELRDEELEHVEMLREAMAKLPSGASDEVEFDIDEAPAL